MIYLHFTGEKVLTIFRFLALRKRRKEETLPLFLTGKIMPFVLVYVRTYRKEAE